MVVILTFLGLIPNSKHLHLCCRRATVFLKSPVLANLPNLDFEKEEVGLEAVKDLPRKQVLDAFTCVECGRCQENCPAFGTGKLLNPKRLILQNEQALLGGKADQKLVELYDEGILWQCTTCGACENQCPVGIEHLPVIIGARRGLVSNGEAADYLGPVYNNLERRGNIWGLLYDQREKFVEVGRSSRSSTRPSTSTSCGSAARAPSRRTSRSRSARCSTFCAQRASPSGCSPRSAVPATSPSAAATSTCSRSWPRRTSRSSRTPRRTKIITSCPHCLKTIGLDYQAFGFHADVVHSSVLVAQLLADTPAQSAGETVTFHDPCYLGRYARHDEEPRALLARVGATVIEPVRNRQNPFCCGAGGGLLFEEHEPGKRISQERFEQLQATGAGNDRDGVPLLFDHAQGRPGERQRAGGDGGPDDLRRRQAQGALARGARVRAQM